MNQPPPPPRSKTPLIIAAIILLLASVGVAIWYFGFRGSSSAKSPESAGDGVNEVIDDQIKEIADDVANSAKEGYMNRIEYMTPDPTQSISEFTRIVLTNIAGKPIKAVVSRDDVSGILKVVMNGVDPKVFEPSLSVISDCVSETIKTGPSDGINALPMNTYNCTNDYFSKNGKEFEDKIVPAILDMYENAFYDYASENERKKIESQGGAKKTLRCYINYRGNDVTNCFKEPGEGPPITWDKVSEIIKAQFDPPDEAAVELVDDPDMVEPLPKKKMY